MAPRAYGPWDARQERNAALAYSEDDLRRIITAALVARRAPVIVLAGDFDLTRRLTLPAALAGIAILGGPGRVLRWRGTTGPAVRIEASEATLQDFELQCLVSADVAITLEGGPDDVTIQRVDFTGASAIHFVAAIQAVEAGPSDPAAVVSRLLVDGCGFQTEKAVIIDADAEIFDCTVRACRRITGVTASSPFCYVGGSPNFLGNSSMDVEASAGATASFGRVHGNDDCNITIGANCSRVTITGNTGSADITTTASDGLNRLAANTVAGSITLHATDINDDDQGGGAPLEPIVFPQSMMGMPSAAVNKAMSNNTSLAIYLGRAAAAWTSFDVRFRVSTAFTISPGNPTWAEAAICTGTPVLGAGTTLTTMGFVNITTEGQSLGNHTVTVATTGITEGDHLWVVIGAQTIAGSFLLEGCPPDRLNSGRHLLATTTRPSTMAAATAFSLDAGNTHFLVVAPS
jgi:hypothetical protein